MIKNKQKKPLEMLLDFMLLFFICSGVAQLVEQVAVNHWVGGSNPST